MGFQMVPMDPMGHREHELLRVLLPEMPLYPQKPYLSLCLFRWSCGGQECPDGVPEGHNLKANCLRSILGFYRPQKACKTPKL